MNEVCVESCAIKRDTSAFEPINNLKLEDMPKFPETKGMTRDERFSVVVVYLSKLVEQAQGVKDEPVYAPIRRPHTDHSSSGPVSSAVQIQSVLHGIQEAIAPPQTREERESDGIPVETMVDAAD